MRNATERDSVVLCVGAAGLSVALFALMARGVLSIPETEQGLAPLIDANLAASGVKNVVTAVLLNFRGYDTLLEIAVLILATIGVLSLRTETSEAGVAIGPAAGSVLSTMTRILVPLMVLIAGYLLWAGEHAPGGAFQAGSVIGAAGVLLALSGYTMPRWATRFVLRLAITIGFIVFLFSALAPILAGYSLLEYPLGLAKMFIILIESWLTLSIGVILVSMFISSAAPYYHRLAKKEES